MEKKNKTKTIASPLASIPPVVTVLGHVDHGKTTLLDAIRKTNIAEKEKGGITQKIGASKIEFINNEQRRQITFIDTPGHEAFSKMRGRGIQAGDVGILVVSSSDGVMPQTKESILYLKQANIPFIVALTKSDLPNRNPEKIKQQLIKEGVEIEAFGGNVPVIEVSAKTNTNIKELLELILLVWELNFNSSISETGSFVAIIIESKQDARVGPLATLVIKNGTLSIKDELICDGVYCRVKSIINDRGEKLKSATVGQAVEVLGFEKVPSVGSLVIKKGAEVVHEGPVKSYSASKLVMPDIRRQTIRETKPFTQDDDSHLISVILCADTLGSLEAIVSILPREVNVVLQKTGNVAPADVIFAKSTGAIILGFHIKIQPDILRLAKTEKVLMKNYMLIYELTDEIKDVLEGKQLEQKEILGVAKVVASFPYEKTKVLGIKVIEGRIAKGDRIRLLRGDNTIGESAISSLRQGKNPISKVEKGNEAGIIISPFLDFAIDDVLISLG